MLWASSSRFLGPGDGPLGVCSVPLFAPPVFAVPLEGCSADGCSPVGRQWGWVFSGMGDGGESLSGGELGTVFFRWTTGPIVVGVAQAAKYRSPCPVSLSSFFPRVLRVNTGSVTLGWNCAIGWPYWGCGEWCGKGRLLGIDAFL